MPADVARVLDRRRRLGHDVPTRGWRIQVDRDDALVGRLEVREHEEARALVADVEVIEVEAVEQRDRLTRRVTSSSSAITCRLLPSVPLLP